LHTALASDEPSYLYDLACYCALRGSLAGAGKKVPSREAVDDLESAMNALRKAVDGGFDNPHKLNTDPHLELIRRRGDFPRLLAEVEARGKDRIGPE
jgi:hypothetical protein